MLALLAGLPGCHTAPTGKYTGDWYGGSMRWIASYGSMIYFEVDPVGEPESAASQSQPVLSGTNLRSTAAGSVR
jgi:hypothetical protein